MAERAAEQKEANRTIEVLEFEATRSDRLEWYAQHPDPKLNAEFYAPINEYLNAIHQYRHARPYVPAWLRLPLRYKEGDEITKKRCPYGHKMIRRHHLVFCMCNGRETGTFSKKVAKKSAKDARSKQGNASSNEC